MPADRVWAWQGFHSDAPGTHRQARFVVAAPSRAAAARAAGESDARRLWNLEETAYPPDVAAATERPGVVRWRGLDERGPDAPYGTYEPPAPRKPKKRRAPEPAAAPRVPPGEVLLPAESLALTVALSQVMRGEEPSPNVATVCVLALARLDGRHDYTAEVTA